MVRGQNVVNLGHSTEYYILLGCGPDRVFFTHHLESPLTSKGTDFREYVARAFGHHILIPVEHDNKLMMCQLKIIKMFKLTAFATSDSANHIFFNDGVSIPPSYPSVAPNDPFNRMGTKAVTAKSHLILLYLVNPCRVVFC